MWRSLLTFLGFSHSTTSLRDECMSRLAALDAHVMEARRVEASAHIREARAAADPNREEVRRLRLKRLDAIDAAFRGKDDIR